MNKNDICFLDLSGYMFSGKSACSDLLREFNTIKVPNVREEFDLLRIPDGINDLSRSMTPWSPICTDIALRKFESLCEMLSYEPMGIEKLWRFNYGFERRFPGFTDETKKFIKKIVNAEWEMPWPYTNHHLSKSEIAILKIKAKLFNINSWRTVNYRLVDKEKFDREVKIYLYNLLSKNIAPDIKIVTLHNAFEPFDPLSSMKYFDNSKSIIVDRDVRDIYMTGIKYSKGFNDMTKIYSKISGAFDVDIFIERQKTLRNHVLIDNDKVLRLRYEDLIFNYNDTLNLIMNFLEISPSMHKDKFRYFDPKVSKSNTRLWDSKDKNIIKIEEQLADYCTL